MTLVEGLGYSGRVDLVWALLLLLIRIDMLSLKLTELVLLRDINYLNVWTTPVTVLSFAFYLLVLFTASEDQFDVVVGVVVFPLIR